MADKITLIVRISDENYHIHIRNASEKLKDVADRAIVKYLKNTCEGMSEAEARNLVTSGNITTARMTFMGSILDFDDSVKETGLENKNKLELILSPENFEQKFKDFQKENLVSKFQKATVPAAYVQNVPLPASFSRGREVDPGQTREAHRSVAPPVPAAYLRSSSSSENELDKWRQPSIREEPDSQLDRGFSLGDRPDLEMSFQEPRSFVEPSVPSPLTPSDEGLEKLVLLIKTSQHVREAERALKQLISTAEMGNVEAQLLLGDLYQSGCKILSRNEQEAYGWYILAFNSGNEAAREKLGSFCKALFSQIPTFLPASLMTSQQKLAFSLIEAIATGTKVPKAQYILGTCHFYGYGTRKDKAKGAKLYAMAAEQGFTLAEYCLGFCYETGSGVDQDNERAYYWFQRAAAKGKVVPASRVKLYTKLQSLHVK